MSETVGYIYILTNPSFPEYVKIGYAKNVESRLKKLNSSECTPFAFRVYATYEVSKSVADKHLHSIIDKLDSSLRSQEYVNGKRRKREFYAMDKDVVFSLLENIAEINGLRDKLIKHELTDEDKTEEIVAKKVRQDNFTFSKCGLKAGDKIQFIRNANITCEIISDKRVIYQGEEYSLSALAQFLLGVDYSVAGPLFFTHNGDRLCDIRDKVENESSN